jgi:fimbrial isopeptide formation D2 family protein/LPXTG-motif cell wall-anchored protein
MMRKDDNMKKFLAILLSVLMVLGMCSVAFADGQGTEGTGTEPAEQPAAATSNNHTITITNTDQNVAHTYEAYKVFAGTLDPATDKLSNIEWGDGVDGAGLLTALKALTIGEATPFATCESAADVADALSKPPFVSTSGLDVASGAIDEVANIISGKLATKAATFTANGTTYTANVTGDGYYFIKDTTTTLTDPTSGAGDTLSKYLLSIVKDVTIVAKDTGINPDKKIVAGSEKVAADSAAIGDTVTFEVTVDVPNTKKYVDHFVFDMKDTLPTGITFTGITSVVVGSATLSDATKTTPNHTADGYDGTAGYYTLKVDDAVPALADGKYPYEATTYDPVAEAGGQKITVIFNEFKKFVEKNNLIGGSNKVTVTYTGVVNDDATFTKTANENTVYFDYSNDPNHDYDGDEPGPDDQQVMGKTPEDKTRTYTTALKIKKVDENGNALAGATFELKGDALNRTVLTGTMYVTEAYTAKNGETVDATTKYWKLTDGSYTTTDPATLTDENAKSRYETPATVYYQVTYNRAELAAKNTDIIVVTGADGIAEFVGLNEGSYTLEELAAPAGYNKLEGQSTIAITWSDPEAEGATAPAKDQGGFTLTATEFAAATTFDASADEFTVEIQNKSGATLPSTGGIGTTIFYVLGSMLALAAVVLLIAKRRVNVTTK